MRQFGYFFDRYIAETSRQSFSQSHLEMDRAQQGKLEALKGMERCIGDEVERRITERFRAAFITSDGDEE